MELDALKVDVCKVFSRTKICFSEIFASNIFAFHFSYKFYPVTVQKDISHVSNKSTMILPCIGFTIFALRITYLKDYKNESCLLNKKL